MFCELSALSNFELIRCEHDHPNRDTTTTTFDRHSSPEVVNFQPIQTEIHYPLEEVHDVNYITRSFNIMKLGIWLNLGIAKLFLVQLMVLFYSIIICEVTRTLLIGSTNDVRNYIRFPRPIIFWGKKQDITTMNWENSDLPTFLIIQIDHWIL